MDSPSIVNGSLRNGSKSTSHSPHPPDTMPIQARDKIDEDLKQETVGADIVVKQEPGQPPKLARGFSQKVVVPQSRQLFTHLPDSTDHALDTFERIEACWYANKNMGYTEHAMECDCAEEWGKSSELLYPCATSRPRMEIPALSSKRLEIGGGIMTRAPLEPHH